MAAEANQTHRGCRNGTATLFGEHDRVMNLVRKIVKDAAVDVGVGERPEDLGEIHSPGVAAAIWRRQLSQEFQSWIDGISPEHLPSARVMLRPDAVRDTVTLLCESAGVPEDAQRELLINDVSVLAEIFSGLMGATFLRLRLDVINSDACRKFHLDSVTARLICTYRGPGTQYGISTEGNDPARVFSVATGAPIVLRGTLWPDPQCSGLMHRSPPVEGSGTTRLVLVLDPVDGPTEEIRF
ncbi:MAG: DUF1826 domain-containing protein [Pseudomonadota bacterium]